MIATARPPSDALLELARGADLDGIAAKVVANERG